jgi:hypothetical protein
MLAARVAAPLPIMGDRREAVKIGWRHEGPAMLTTQDASRPLAATRW